MRVNVSETVLSIWWPTRALSPCASRARAKLSSCGASDHSIQYAATLRPYKNMAKPSLNVLSASWMDARSSRLDERMDVSSARLPKGPSRKDSGVEDAPRDCERAEMEPRDTLRKGVVGRLTDMMMVREEVVDVCGGCVWCASPGRV